MNRPKKNQPQKTSSPFKKLRLNVKLSQETLANKIGVSVSTIRRWEKGMTEPTMNIIQFKRFIQAVERDLDDLPNSLLLDYSDTEDVQYQLPHCKTENDSTSEIGDIISI